MRLIDADALKTKAIKCETFKLTDAPVFFKAVGTKEIDKAPTIDAEPVRHGHWKDKRRYEIGPCVDDDGWVELQELCSACNMWVITDWRSPEYCSKCGAQMRRVSE